MKKVAQRSFMTPAQQKNITPRRKYEKGKKFGEKEKCQEKENLGKRERKRSTLSDNQGKKGSK